MLEREERHGRFGPDQVRHAGEVVAAASGDVPRKIELIAKDIALLIGSPFVALNDDGLNDADLDAIHEWDRPCRNAPSAIGLEP
jgi:hypothetical protein